MRGIQWLVGMVKAVGATAGKNGAGYLAVPGSAVKRGRRPVTRAKR
jgi:hypothetical protein